MTSASNGTATLTPKATVACTVAIAVDDSPQSSGALSWVVDNLFPDKQSGKLHILTVLPPMTYPVTPVAPIATAGAVAAITNNWEQQQHAAEQLAQKVVHTATALAKENGIPTDHIVEHILPAAGGASGVAESIVTWANAHLPSIMVLGCRGMGAMKRSLMSMVGLGSVSDYAVHNSHVPVLVYHPIMSSSQAINGAQLTQVEQQVSAEAQGEGGDKAHIPRPPRSRHIMLAIDDSPHSQKLMMWSLEYLLQPRDQLHLVSVAVPVPFPVVDETSAAVNMVETQTWQEQREQALKDAYMLCQRAVEIAAKHIPKARIWYRNLLPEGGASDVAQSICHYAKDNKVDLVVVGSRGMGAFKRSVSAFFGLGSVSDWVVHNTPMPVLIYKDK